MLEHCIATSELEMRLRNQMAALGLNANSRPASAAAATSSATSSTSTNSGAMGTACDGYMASGVTSGSAAAAAAAAAPSGASLSQPVGHAGLLGCNSLSSIVPDGSHMGVGSYYVGPPGSSKQQAQEAARELLHVACNGTALKPDPDGAPQAQHPGQEPSSWGEQQQQQQQHLPQLHLQHQPACMMPLAAGDAAMYPYQPRPALAGGQPALSGLVPSASSASLSVQLAGADSDPLPLPLQPVESDSDARRLFRRYIGRCMHLLLRIDQPTPGRWARQQGREAQTAGRPCVAAALRGGGWWRGGLLQCITWPACSPPLSKHALLSNTHHPTLNARCAQMPLHWQRSTCSCLQWRRCCMTSSCVHTTAAAPGSRR